MGYLKNQRGNTLAITLIIIVIFTVLGFGLVTLNTSASKQFNNTEQKVQARHFAEMGLVHYKSEAKKTIELHNSTINEINSDSLLSEEEKINSINNENDKICGKLKDPTIINRVNEEDSNYDISITKCHPNSEKTLVDITVKGSGNSSQGRVVNIDLNLSVTLPGTLTATGANNSGGTGHGGNGSSSTPPVLPPPPASGTNKTWPCHDKHCGTLTVNQYTDVSDIGDEDNDNNGNGKGNKKESDKDNGDTIFIQKGNLLFNDSLVMKNFEVGGGNGLDLTVGKDFYLKGKLDIQNHACIKVKGNFTSLNSISFGTKSYLYIYGDANLNSSDLHRNSTIFVSGDVFINGVKQNPKTYSPVPNSSEHNGCSLPGVTTTDSPKPNNPIKGNLDAQLITNEYIY